MRCNDRRNPSTAPPLSSPSKEDVLATRNKHVSGCMSVSYANSGPLMIVEGRGCRLIDETGCSFLDTRNNVAHVGHSHPTVVKAVQEQVAVLNTNSRYLHPNMTTLAARLANLLPDPLEVVFFCNSGSEANDLALRLARAWSGGSMNTIVVEGAYHGHTLGTLEVSPYKYECGTEYGSVAGKSSLSNSSKSKTNKNGSPGDHIWKVPCPDVYRGEYRDENAMQYVTSVQEACRYYQEERGESVRAFIVEGGMSVAGVVLPPEGYLQACATAVRKAGGLYIADEVQTGFGRLGSCFWAFEYTNRQNNNKSTEENEERTTVVPDIVTVGKPFGNGMPLAAVVTTKHIAATFEGCGVEYFNTFGGNPVCTAAGLAMLDVLEEENLQQNAKQIGNYLNTRLKRLQETTCSHILGDIRGSGLFLGIELVKDRLTREAATMETSYICSILKSKYKILTSIDGLYDNVLVVKPPLSFSEEDADLFLGCFEQAVINDLPAAGDVLYKASKTPT